MGLINYSPELCQYIGRAEVIAHHTNNSFDRYKSYRSALEEIPRSKLRGDDFRLAIEILESKVKESEPSNIGCASGEAGEAD